MKVVFSSADATHNAQFVLNLVHWPDEVKEYNGRNLQYDPVHASPDKQNSH
jgi:hypothetical protein